MCISLLSDEHIHMHGFVSASGIVVRIYSSGAALWKPLFVRLYMHSYSVGKTVSYTCHPGT